jgi:hypothetical protein
MIKYRINGEYLDLFSDLKDFAITKQISKIGEINSRHGDFSTAFKVPLTSNNARILRYTPELNNNTDVGQFRRYDGQLVEDEAVISDGYYQVTKFSPTKKEIEVKFFGGNSDWFDLLKDRYINIEVTSGEFPYLLTEFQHDFTSANVVGSWDFSKPYYYFLRDNGRNSYVTKSTVLDYQEDFAVSFLEKKVFNKIFESVDIKTQGTLFNDVSFDRTIVASVTDTRDTFVSDDRITNFSIVPTLTSLVNESVPTWTSVRFDAGDYNNQWNGTTFTAANFIGDLRFNFFLAIEAPSNVSNLKIRVFKNGTPTDYTMNYDGGTVQRVFSYNLIETSVNSGDVFEFQFAFVGPVAGSFADVKGGQFSGLGITEQFISPLIDASKILPKIKQTDFIKDILIRYGVISYYDVKTKTLTLNKFEDIDNNRLNAPDWTNKIDLSKEIEVDFTKILSNYGKRSVFDYEDDTEADTDASIYKSAFGYNAGTGIIDVQNDFLSDENTIYTSVYAPSLNRYSLPKDSGRWYVPFLPTQKPEGEDSGGNLTFDAQELKPRLMYAVTLNVSDINNQGYSQVEIDSSFYNNIGYAYFSKVRVDDTGGQGLNDSLESIMYGNLDNQFFVGDSLLQKNYAFYQKILNAPFYVSLYMNLTALDVQQLDFFTPIFLEYKYDSGYYYIDSVEQYKGDGSTTKINLVKI